MASADRPNPGPRSDHSTPAKGVSRAIPSDRRITLRIAGIEDLVARLRDADRNAEGGRSEWHRAVEAAIRRYSLVLCADFRGEDDRLWDDLPPLGSVRSRHGPWDLELWDLYHANRPTGHPDSNQIRLVRRLPSD